MKDRLEFKGAVIGMLMGDASLSQDRKNSMLRFSQTEKHEDYAKWKIEILEQLTSVGIWRGNVDAFGKTYRGLRIWTKSHPFYTGLRERMYHDNRKTFDMHCLKRLTMKGLLIWYLDDGCMTKVKTTPAIYLCTDRYNYMEHLSIQKLLHDRWGLSTRMTKHGKHWRLRFPAESGRKLIGLFEPYINEIPACMHYKLDLSDGTPSVDDGKRQSMGDKGESSPCSEN